MRAAHSDLGGHIQTAGKTPIYKSHLMVPISAFLVLFSALMPSLLAAYYQMDG